MKKLNLRIILKEKDGIIYAKDYDSHNMFYKYSEQYGNVEIQVYDTFENLDVELICMNLNIKNLKLDFSSVKTYNLLCNLEDCVDLETFKMENGSVTYLRLKNVFKLDLCIPNYNILDADENFMERLKNRNIRDVAGILYRL